MSLGGYVKLDEVGDKSSYSLRAHPIRGELRQIAVYSEKMNVRREIDSVKLDVVFDIEKDRFGSFDIP